MTEPKDFEQILKALEVVVERLQQPDVPLAEAVLLYKRGTELAESAEALLSDAELQVQRLTHAVQERVAQYAEETEE